MSAEQTSLHRPKSRQKLSKQYYSNNVIKAISPYAAADAGMIAVVLRHLADEIESKNVGAKEFAEWLDEHTKKPPLTETQVVKKPNMQ